jgi:F5/8 type C domain-containing protein
VFLRPAPHNRWTAYESPNATDWLEIDFGGKKEVGRVELYIYDDGGGVQAPERYAVQFWDGKEWRDVPGQKKSPEAPAGGARNTVTFPPLSTAKVRVVCTHKGKARSGLTEIEIWGK